jgi:hypothetical protein
VGLGVLYKKTKPTAPEPQPKKKLINPIKFFKKPAGSVRFRFYKKKPNRTEPKPTKNREKNRAKTEPNRKKPSQNRKKPSQN